MSGGVGGLWCRQPSFGLTWKGVETFLCALDGGVVVRASYRHEVHCSKMCPLTAFHLYFPLELRYLQGYVDTYSDL